MCIICRIFLRSPMRTTHSRYRFWLMLVIILALAAACSAQKPAVPLPQAPQSVDAPAVPLTGFQFTTQAQGRHLAFCLD